MEFAIFGVPFKCTKDMFSLEQAKWTLFIYWAQLWRDLILGGILGVFMGGIIWTNPEWSTSWLALFVLIVIIAALSITYIQYYVLLQKKYQSFDKGFTTPHMPQSFWSWTFWKIFLLTIGIGWGVGFLVGLFLHQKLAFVCNLVLGTILFHIFLHGGTWGFIPVPKNKENSTT
jgi:hypothetical protein